MPIPPDAAMYYLARIVEAGEEPLVIAAPHVFSSSEESGAKTPHLRGCTAFFRACEVIAIRNAPATSRMASRI